MYRGTTPTIKLTIQGLSDIDISKIYLTLKQFDTVIEKDLDSLHINGNILSYTFSQEETLSLSEAKVELQVRILSKSGVAYATKKMALQVSDILKEGVI